MPTVTRNLINVIGMRFSTRPSRSFLLRSEKRSSRQRSFSSRFSADSILRSEFIYGEGFQGPGGDRTMRSFAAGLEKDGLVAGAQVVELGCGLGGPANYLANTYGVNVTGVDISPDMISLCKTRQKTKNSKDTVEYLCASITDVSLFDPSSVDLVWSRDTIMYLDRESKREAVEAMAMWLRPGGRFMIGDFGRCFLPDVSAGFLEYVESSHMTTLHLDEYVELLEESGELVVTTAEDVTDLFIRYNKVDLEAFLKRRDEFETKWPGPYFDELVERWRLKITIAEEGAFVYQRLVGHRRKVEQEDTGNHRF